MGSSSNCSVFEYVYRDASNYKQFGEVLLTGLATDLDRQMISKSLFEGEFFLPKAVGLPPLQQNWDDYPTNDDHDWHEFRAMRPAEGRDITELQCWGSMGALVERFNSVGDWTLHFVDRGTASND